jgi:predicted acylesterase/phospholipase RssA
MGMLGEAELTPFDVFTGLSIDSVDGAVTATTDTWNGKFRATNRVTYTREKIVADLGTRLPKAADAQKSFRLLTVVLTQSDALPQATQDMLDGMLARMRIQGDNGLTSCNFWEATAQRGTISFDVYPSEARS